MTVYICANYLSFSFLWFIRNIVCFKFIIITMYIYYYINTKYIFNTTTWKYFHVIHDCFFCMYIKTYWNFLKLNLFILFLNLTWGFYKGAYLFLFGIIIISVLISIFMLFFFKTWQIIRPGWIKSGCSCFAW